MNFKTTFFFFFFFFFFWGGGGGGGGGGAGSVKYSRSKAKIPLLLNFTGRVVQPYREGKSCSTFGLILPSCLGGYSVMDRKKKK